MNCPSCGSVTTGAGRFCDTCGEALDSEPARPVAGPGAAPAEGSQPAPSARARPATLPGTPILLGDGEVIWRQYRVLELRHPSQGEGMLFVTDARVVFYARARGRGTQRPSALVQQTKLEHITGLAAYVSRRISLVLLVITFLLALATIAELARRSWLTAIILAAVTAGCASMLVHGAANRGTVGVMIQSGSTQASPIQFGEFGEQRGFLGRIVHALFLPMAYLFGAYTAFDVLLGFPGQDSEQVIAELGALIFDLQTLGNVAGTHWGMAASDGQRATAARESGT
jgi:hypothetical protein